MIIPAFFVASMVGFHVEFSQSMYSSKCPYSTPMYCTRVTGPSVYWRSSWARALSEKEEAARPIDKIIVLIIFVSPVVIYFYSANTPSIPDMFMQIENYTNSLLSRLLFHWSTILLIRRENACLGRRPCSMICADRSAHYSTLKTQRP